MFLPTFTDVYVCVHETGCETEREREKSGLCGNNIFYSVI